MNSYLDYTDNPYENEAEQLYQLYLRSAMNRSNQDRYNRETPSLSDYQNALEDVIKDREGQPIFPPGFKTVNDPNVNFEAYKSEIARAAKAFQRSPNPSRALRNVDHGLQSQVDSWGQPVLNRLLRPPVYNLMKLLAQSNPTIGQYIDKHGIREQEDDPHPFTEASPPGWDSIWWGLRSFWGKN